MTCRGGRGPPWTATPRHGSPGWYNAHREGGFGEEALNRIMAKIARGEEEQVWEMEERWAKEMSAFEGAWSISGLDR